VSRKRFHRLVAICVAGVVTSLPVTAAAPRKPEVLVLAAASLTDVLGDLAARWEESSGIHASLSFAASAVLARQIEAGGNADVFISADPDWADYLAARHLIDTGSRRNVAGNRLVLIAPADNPLTLTIAPGFRLRDALGGGRLATGDPDTVPVGRYARSALIKLGVWNEVAGRLVRADNVRSAMMFVSRGEVPLGIVYATDAAADIRVRIVDTFPADTHAPIVYPAAALNGARPGARAFVAFLGGESARVAWRKYGFVDASP
jgi:molybdate transport system substrate-binding protein